jgi:Leucine-rich repeat (LRR) protein
MSTLTIADSPTLAAVPARPRSWWRRVPLRLSLRTLLVVILMLAGVLGWVVHLAHVQGDAVAAIRSGGGQATYNWQLKRLPNGSRRVDPKARPWAPQWLLEAVGPDYFGHVETVQVGRHRRDKVLEHVGRLDQLREIRFIEGIDLGRVVHAGLNALPDTGLARFEGLGEIFVELSSPALDGASFKYLRNHTRLEKLNLPNGTSVTDADLAYLSRLTALTSLSLRDPRITDAGIDSLKNMTRLESLVLSGTQVTGAGLRSLRAMTKLNSLNLNGMPIADLRAIAHLSGLAKLSLSFTPIDDRGLASVTSLVGLVELHLHNTEVSSAGVAYLKDLPKLRSLSLSNTRVDDEASVVLAKLMSLTDLQLSNTQITDAGLAQLERIPKLATLSVDGTQVSDAGLELLAGCHALRRLTVRKTKVTRGGLSAFKTARPDVRVFGR